MYGVLGGREEWGTHFQASNWTPRSHIWYRYLFVTIHVIVDDAQLNHMPRPLSGQGMLKTIIN